MTRILKQGDTATIRFVESLIHKSTGARLTTSATVRVSIDGTWGDGAGTLSLDEADQWRYSLHASEAAARNLEIAIDHADAIGPIGGSFTLLDARSYALSVQGAEFNERGGRIWYLAAGGGNDSNPGTSGAPLATFAQAQTNALAGRDTIFFLAGTYTTAISVTKTGLILAGEGEASLIQVSAASAALTLADYSVVRNIKVESTSSSTAAMGISLNSTRNVVLDRVVAVGLYDAFQAVSALRPRFTHCSFIGTYDSGNVTGAERLYAEHCLFQTNGTFAAATAHRGLYVGGGIGHFHGCSFRAVRTAADSIRLSAVELSNANYNCTFDNCLFFAATTNAGNTSTVNGVSYASDGSVALNAQIRNSRIRLSNAGSGASRSIDASTSGSLVTLENCIVDESQIIEHTAAANVFINDGALRPLVNGRKANFAADGDLGGNVDGSIVGDVGGKLLGGGASSFVGVGSRADNRDGQDIATPGDQMNLANGAITANSIASAAFTAAKFASGAFDSVWSTTTRLLTAGTNIVLAKGTGVTGFNDLSAAQVNAEVDVAIADVGLTTGRTENLDNLDYSASDLYLIGLTAIELSNTVLARLGSWSTSGTNTVLGAFRALFRKAGASLPTDIGGTYDPATDSLEGLRDNHPANFATLGINGSGHVSRVSLVDANSDYVAPPTAQQIRDAMKLAPSGGAAATNSIDDKIDSVESGGGGVTIPVIQIPVPATRTWILKHTDDGLRGELPIVRSIGEHQPFAVDFRNDLPNNGRLISLDSIDFVGPDGGIVIDDDDRGVDRSQAKIVLQLLEAGTYVITLSVEYDDSDGGGTSIGSVTLIVK